MVKIVMNRFRSSILAFLLVSPLSAAEIKILPAKVVLSGPHAGQRLDRSHRLPPLLDRRPSAG